MSDTALEKEDLAIQVEELGINGRNAVGYVLENPSDFSKDVVKMAEKIRELRRKADVDCMAGGFYAFSTFSGLVMTVGGFLTMEAASHADLPPEAKTGVALVFVASGLLTAISGGLTYKTTRDYDVNSSKADEISRGRFYNTVAPLLVKALSSSSDQDREK